MAFQTKSKANLADIISFCNETKSERGCSPVGSHSDVNIDTISLQSKSPINFNNERTWSSAGREEVLEFSAKKQYAVLDMIAEKNWKVNIRSKIESDLSDQVQQALAPIISTKKKWSEKKKAERQKNLQMFRLNGFHQNKFSRLTSEPRNVGNVNSGSFKYIDANYIPQHRVLAGGGDPFFTKEVNPRAIANIRLPRRNGLHSHSIYGLEDMARMQKHAANLKGGLDVTLLDSHSNFNFFNLPKHDGGPNNLRPLVPNVITYNGMSLPNYGVNRRCFQMYTKEGMNSLLSSRTRRGKLTHVGHGKYVDKRGVVISRLGPFWPQGYGPVCQCPEFIAVCPKAENLIPPTEKLTKSGDSMVSTAITSSGNNPWLMKSGANGRQENANYSQNNPPVNSSSNQLNQKNLPHNSSLNQISQKTTTALPREMTTTNFSNSKQPQGSIVRQQGQDGQPVAKPLWRGKPVIFDSERSSRAPLPHSIVDGMDESLVFESRFESGNLRQVRRIEEHEYELVLRTDMYTNRHTQWYYFRIQKAKRACKYKLNIINFLKKDSLYNYGMKPLIYSEKLASSQELGWHRSGEKIKYSAWNNSTRNATLSLDMQYYCLEFEITFDWDDVEEDTIYLAHCYPYTYSDLRRHLDQMMSSSETSQHVKKEVLCETTAGNACFLLTITDFPDREKDKYKDFHQEKRGVVITSRVHPGESQASWMMKGVLDYLTSDHPTAQKLRERFVFKIVPMLNPDGVIVGNYRTSLSARDLNRNYRHPKQTTFPTVWHTKQMVDQFNKDHPIILYCDLHGHSRKHMVFMYGCERKAYYAKSGKKGNNCNENVNKRSADEDSLQETRDFVEERLFPWLMHTLAPTRFSFRETKFAVRRSKESTGRVVMFRQMGIWNSFTMEASFSGTTMSDSNGRHFNIDDFQLMGRKLCDCVLEYSRICEDSIAKSRAILDMTRDIAQQLISRQKVSAVSSNLPGLKSTPDDAGKIAQNGLPSSNTGAVNLPQSKILSNSEPNIPMKVNKTTYTNNGSNKQQDLPNANRKKNATSDRIVENAQDIDKITDRDGTQKTAVNKQPAANANAIGNQDSAAPNQDTEAPQLDMNCFKLLRSLNIHQMELESETSSESNSDSEPEIPIDSSAFGNKKLRPQANSGGGRKKKRRKRQQKFGKSISAPSNIQSSHASPKKTIEEQISKDLKSKTNYPGYVNKYANRSNGGIPIFAQERIKERAARRLAELKVVEEDRKQQENRLRQQLLMSGIQDGPNISQEIPVSHSDHEDNNVYSEVCGVRYKVNNQPRKVHYMLYNPYRNQSPESGPARRPLVTMRFSPPNQLRHQQVEEDSSTSFQWKSNDVQDLYTPYRVQAPAGRLSNQRGFSSLTEISDTSTPATPTEPSSSQSSDRVSDDEKRCHTDIDVKYGEGGSPPDGEKFEPRSVVVPLQKYNLSFKMYKKPWNQKPNFAAAIQRRPTEVDELDISQLQQIHESGVQDNRTYQTNVSELLLPPQMHASDALTAHMRYPTQVHRVEAMRPLPRGRTISRGPPMVFGEPVVMNQKPPEIASDTLSFDAGEGAKVEGSFIRSASLAQLKRSSSQVHVRHHELPYKNISLDTYQQQMENPRQAGNLDKEVIDKDSFVNFDTRKMTEPLFVPRFVAIAPPRGNKATEANGVVPTSGKGNLTERTLKQGEKRDSAPHSFTVR